MNCSKIKSSTTTAQARAPFDFNEAKDTERVITTSADSQSVFLPVDSRGATPSSPWPLMDDACTATPKSANGNQLLSIPNRNPATPLLGVQRVQIENGFQKEADLLSPVVMSSGTNRARKPSFAYKLHALLMDKDCNSAITWLPSGEAFCIIDKEEFTKKVLPKYFGETKFESFSRRIKRWGFHRMYTTGVKQVIYSHDLFKKDRVDLCKLMNGRAGQSAKEDGHVASFKPDRFETVMSEQVALAEKSSSAHCQSFRTKEFEQRRLQTTAHRSILSLYQVPKAFVDEEIATAYHHMSHEHPMGIVNFPTQAFFASHERYPMLEFEPSYMPFERMRDMHGVRQLSALDADIADCQQQLAILHRLKILKDKRRALHH
ncbi:hypothetical protein HJC23_007290 [Cyclotella cryptica]|uniref:HSF-type DNA-binding domain-containing protein n=1 Tax=Cyclotella cryptica TaxID=29204 RepID=A0ABD3Q050_9STRA